MRPRSYARIPAAFFKRAFFVRAVLALVAIVFAASACHAQALTPAWVELGEDGKAFARIVVSNPGDCPAIQIDGASKPMSLRPNMPEGLRPACEVEIPAGAKTASVNSRPLALPKINPTEVIALGDTGCRIKGRQIQACNDPALWPFREVASSATGEKPDLIVHVGDYLYRESPCPENAQTECGGSPAGYDWAAWNADFFEPAATLLSAVPWTFTRGNHEDCDRAWQGWFYYLDPRPWDGKCQQFSPAYVVRLGNFQLAMLDSSGINENIVDVQELGILVKQLTSLQVKDAWLATHRPFWGFYPDKRSGRPEPTTAVLEEAWNKAAPRNIGAILSGHIHLFEYVSLDHGRPPQIVAGDGGTQMDVPIEISLKGTTLRGATVSGNRINQRFGYTLLTKEGKNWHLELKDWHRKVLVTCTVPESSEGCQSAGE
ncbi:MAG TPA: metallophosphoesterase [Candidatus Acidoferrales bacterium]|nr:metallophosphoesterase [Candidatus Acidoferrales bacterium]